MMIQKKNSQDLFLSSLKRKAKTIVKTFIPFIKVLMMTGMVQ